MSRWDDEFDNHPVFPAQAAARENLEAVTNQLADTEQVEAHARFGRVLDYIEASLKVVDPELVPPGFLDQIMNSLNAATTSLQQFKDQPQQALLDQANSQADSAVGQMRQLAPRFTDEVPDMQGALSTFRRSVGQHLRNIESEVAGVGSRAAEIKAQLDTQEEKIQGQDARLDTVVSQFQEQFSAAQAQRQTETGQVIEEGRSQLRAALEEAAAVARDAVATARGELTELLEQSKAASDEALAAANERADRQFEQVSKTGDERVAKLDELLEKAVKTVGVIGSTGMAGGYQIVADKEKKAADFWRWVTVIGLLGAIGAPIFAVAHGVAHGFDFNTFFAKWAISLPFAALAGYAGLESSKHREQERINRKVELQLASLDAYLVTLPEDEQNRLRAKLTNRFFGELTRAPGDESEPAE
jgi:hypothetical protein